MRDRLRRYDARVRRGRRPWREDPALDGLAVEVGRRAGLHTRKSQTSYIARMANRRDRREAREQLNRDPDTVQINQQRGSALRLVY